MKKETCMRTFSSLADGEDTSPDHSDVSLVLIVAVLVATFTLAIGFNAGYLAGVNHRPAAKYGGVCDVEK